MAFGKYARFLIEKEGDKNRLRFRRVNSDFNELYSIRVLFFLFRCIFRIFRFSEFQSEAIRIHGTTSECSIYRVPCYLFSCRVLSPQVDSGIIFNLSHREISRDLLENVTLE